MPPLNQDNQLLQCLELTRHIQNYTCKQLARQDDEILKLRHRIEELEQHQKQYIRKHQLAANRDLYDAQD